MQGTRSQHRCCAGYSPLCKPLLSADRVKITKAIALKLNTIQEVKATSVVSV